MEEVCSLGNNKRITADPDRRGKNNLLNYLIYLFLINKH